MLIKNLIYSVLVAGILNGPTLAKESDKKSPCTQDKLEKLRKNEFQDLFKKEKYVEAADLLNKYIDKNDCWTALIYEKNDESKFISYLWAINDIALANSKSQNHVKCIELLSTPVSGTNGDILFPPENSEVKKSFATNLKRCHENRLKNLQTEQLSKCSIPLEQQSIQMNKTAPSKKIKISAILNSFQLSKHRCVAQVTVELTEGSKTDQIPFLVDAQLLGEKMNIKIVKSLNDPKKSGYRCWSENRMTPFKNSKNIQFIRLEGDWKNCFEEAYEGGSYDSLFELADEINQRDEINIQAH